MAWERRPRGEVYYTHTRCVDGRKIREYYGNGPRAKAVAAEDQQRRQNQRQEWAEVTALGDALKALDTLLDELEAHSHRLRTAELVGAGYYRQCRAWRRRRPRGSDHGTG